MSIDFLITYDSNSKEYLFYSDNKDYSEIEITGILRHEVIPFAPNYVSCSEEETEVETGVEYYIYDNESDTYVIVDNPQGSPYENRYYRKEENPVNNLCNTSVITEVFELQNSTDNVRTLSHAPREVQSFFASVDENKVDSQINISDNNLNISFAEIIDVPIRFQISYVVAKEIQESQNYTINLYDENGTVLQSLTNIPCVLIAEVLCLGDYNTYLGVSDEETPQTPEVCTVEQISENLYSTPINTTIEYSEEEDINYRYRVIFGVALNTQEYLCYSKQAEVDNKQIIYIGNLFILTKQESDRDEFPFLVVTDNEVFTLYTETGGEYTISITPYNLIEIPSLAGGTLLSFGNLEWDEDSQQYITKENYGIGINSSDVAMGFPARAISLFESYIHPEESIKVSYNYRGILGTLPNAIDINLPQDGLYSNYMAGTQGIFTDNMYIGDENQYVAFYTDPADEQKHLKISAKDIIYEIKDGKETSWDQHIDERVDDAAEEALDNRLKYFWQNLEGSSTYPAGTYMAGGNEKAFDKTNSETYGYNTFMDNTSLKFRHNANVITEIGEKIVLGDKTQLHLEIEKDKISFKSGEIEGVSGKDVSYIDSEKLYIPYSVVLNEMMIGEDDDGEIKKPLWAWQVDKEKHLRLVWLGDTSEEENENG